MHTPEIHLKLQKDREAGDTFRQSGSIQSPFNLVWLLLTMHAVAIPAEVKRLPLICFWQRLTSSIFVIMQLARAFAAICLGFIASLSLQGCGSDDADTVSAAGDTNETTVTVTMTETMTMTTTSTVTTVA